VSPTAGTTRDYLEERLAHNGVQFRLVDTAGLRETEDTIEAEGVARAAELIAVADHVLYLIDPTEAVDLEAECAIAEALRVEYPRTSLSVVLTKSDKHSVEHAGTVRCSIHDADSIRTILDGLTASYSQNLAESIALVTDRQFRHLSAMHEILSGIGDDVLEQTELLSAELRALLRPLSELTGEIVTDDVLNALFGSFCIGK
jgi:tRNA modification GTPase